MRFRETAVNKGVSVVRVQALQVRSNMPPHYLAAAIKVAAASTCIVLSCGYNSVMLYQNNKHCTYAQLLAEQLSGFRVITAAYGNIVIFRQ